MPAGDAEDHVYQHSISLLWHGLQMLANRDAVREGDGPAMLMFWKQHMVTNFWQHHHPKYTIIGHRLLACMDNEVVWVIGSLIVFIAVTAGCASESLVHQLTWERVANLRGGKGRNVGLDLINEFVNNDYKGQMCYNNYQTFMDYTVCSDSYDNEYFDPL